MPYKHTHTKTNTHIYKGTHTHKHIQRAMDEPLTESKYRFAIVESLMQLTSSRKMGLKPVDESQPLMASKVRKRL